MRHPRLVGMLGGWLACAPFVCAGNPPSADFVVASVPQGTASPPERPELPNIDPRFDVTPLVRPCDPPVAPACPLLPKGRCGPDYDPSVLFLPERNPGIRQAPCPCLPLGDWWLDAAYFLGKTQNDSVPALVTAGGSGIPGAPGVTTLHGGERLDQPFRSGLRIETGLWFDHCHNWGLDGSFFILQSTQSQFSAASAGTPLLAQPNLGQPGNVPSANVLAAPGLSRGAVGVSSPLDFLGGDANLRHTLFCEDSGRVDLLVGYRFGQMAEQVGIAATSESTTGTIRDTSDTFRTMNLFNGAQIGLAGEYRFDRLYVSGSGKIAFGVNTGRLDVNGYTRMQTPGSPTIATSGGLLTGPSNIGATHDESFAVVPEANFNVGYQVTEHWRAFVGYTFIYQSSVARPGQSIDMNVGTSTAGVVQPTRNEVNTDFWMHGINVGVEARY
jgi:Putative beta barrel porin-7 (BBP7)